MLVTLGLRTVNWQRIGLVFLLIFIALLGSKVLTSGYYKYLLILSFLGAVLFLYLKQYELFILLVVVLNGEFFFLLPREILGRANYQDLLYIILPITGAWYFFRKSDRDEKNFNGFTISFLLLILMGVFNSYSQGQPIILGLKAAKGYYLVLFYFVFMGKIINRQRLFKLIVITGVLLSFLNNIQYFYFGGLKIFHVSSSLERAGQLRFLVGDFFTIFAPIIALSVYITAKKKLYLVAFFYMLGTVIVQAKTRAVIWGFIITILLMMYYSKKINLLKVVFAGIPLLAAFVWLLPLIKSTAFGEIYEVTKYEFTAKTGNVGIRFDAYDYYVSEISKSPIIGRGIWNYLFRENNPEDVEKRGLYLADIGITSFIFHFGLVGAIWLLVLFARIYRLAFLSIGQLKRAVPYGLVGYLIFSIFTMPTLNCLVDRRTIIYLVLVLALFSQLDFSHQRNSQA
jgi:hypothetical protein